MNPPVLAGKQGLVHTSALRGHWMQSRGSTGRDGEEGKMVRERERKKERETERQKERVTESPGTSSYQWGLSHLHPISKTNQIRHTGHCLRSKDELISYILQWIPSHGRARVGRSARIYLQQLCADTGCTQEDLREATEGKEEWRERVREIRASST